ncbi:MAG: TIGR04282 family arsenosugar biosynthesis glycosyltransferase [Flavobacteriaceae bacterium]
MKKTFSLKTAVLVFANSPEEEMRQKPLHNATNLFADLTRRVLQTVSKSGFTYFHIDESMQRGGDFGERFTNAIRDIFDAGYEYLITVGNDSPGLKTEHILKAATQLHRGKFVLGPSTDGGFYLMGLQKARFYPVEFRELPWQTSGLRATLITLMAKRGVRVSCLSILMDIDTLADIEVLVKYNYNVPISILNYLWSISASESPVMDQNASWCTSDIIFPFYNKGSPNRYAVTI